jgi:glycerate 2-kinase
LDRLHSDVLHAMDKALETANPHNIIRRHVKLDSGTLHVDNVAYPLRRYHRIFLIGAGKASGYMGEELERLLGGKVTTGQVIVPDYLRPWPKSRRVNYYPGTHPIPSEKNVKGATQVMKLVESANHHDLVIALLSGGASALMDYPLPGITVKDERKTTDLLLKSGAKIQEINTVRKHLSRVKGGRLAEVLRDVQLLTLIISDVVGDQLDAIGSGPTAPDPTTYLDAKRVLEKYDLWSKVPAHVRIVVERGVRGIIPDTPKQGRIFRLVKNVIVGNNRESCLAAASEMKRRGYDAHVLSTCIAGEAREVGEVFGSIIAGVRDPGSSSHPSAFILGGETTVTVKRSGKGGRNQELALGAATTIDGQNGVVVGSFGTDGVDGPTDAAGALVDGTTVARGRKRGMEPEEFLENNDSYNYFARLGDLVKTGPTGTNVNDIIILVAE